MSQNKAVICPKCGSVWMEGFDNQFNCEYCGMEYVATKLDYIMYLKMSGSEGEQFRLSFQPYEKYDAQAYQYREEQEAIWNKKVEEDTKVREEKLKYTPKCPTCGSPNVQPISSLERGGSVFAWGLFSKKINKTYKCNNCKYTW